MPLSCIDPTTGNILQTVDLNDEAWDALKSRNNDRDRHLRTKCCGAEVVLKGTDNVAKHFAHKRKPESCTAKPETKHHRRLKELAYQAALRAGWQPEMEVHVAAANRFADVLAKPPEQCRGTLPIAVEIQWSPQTHATTLERHANYAGHARCLWVMRKGRSQRLDDRRVPVVGVEYEADGEEADGEYVVTTNNGRTRTPAHAFFDDLYAGRFVYSKTYRCWGVKGTGNTTSGGVGEAQRKTRRDKVHALPISKAELNALHAAIEATRSVRTSARP